MTISALIIDDEQLAREELKYLLDSVGGVDVVAQGANGIEAVDLIEEHHPDLVFLDVQMPGQDGFAVIQRVMERTRKDAAALAKGDAKKRGGESTLESKRGRGAAAAFCVCDGVRPVRGARLQCECMDYLLKPFDDRAGSAAVERVRARLATGGSTRTLRRGCGIATESAAAFARSAADLNEQGRPPAKLIVQAQSRLPLEFVVIGYTQDDGPLLKTGMISITGRYSEIEAPHLIERERPDVIFLPSVWPETWCYALDYALATGLPVVAFDLGAIAERLRASGRGILLPLNLGPQQINDRLLARVAEHRNPQAYVQRMLSPAHDDAKMEPSKGSRIMTPSIGDTPQEEGLSASLQVLPLPPGLYLFSVKAAAALAERSRSNLNLPAMHVGLGPGVRSEQVEFLSGPGTDGAWLFTHGDVLVAKINGSGATLILTSVRSSNGEVLAIEVERLEARSQATISAPTASMNQPIKPPAVATDEASVRAPSKAATIGDPAADSLALPLQIKTHIRSRGDMNFSDAPGPDAWRRDFGLNPSRSSRSSNSARATSNTRASPAPASKLRGSATIRFAVPKAWPCRWWDSRFVSSRELKRRLTTANIPATIDRALPSGRCATALPAVRRWRMIRSRAYKSASSSVPRRPRRLPRSSRSVSSLRVQVSRRRRLAGIATQNPRRGSETPKAGAPKETKHLKPADAPRRANGTRPAQRSQNRSS